MHDPRICLTHVVHRIQMSVCNRFETDKAEAVPSRHSLLHVSCLQISKRTIDCSSGWCESAMPTTMTLLKSFGLRSSVSTIESSELGFGGEDPQGGHCEEYARGVGSQVV